MEVRHKNNNNQTASSDRSLLALWRLFKQCKSQNNYDDDNYDDYDEDYGTIPGQFMTSY